MRRGGGCSYRTFEPGDVAGILAAAAAAWQHDTVTESWLTDYVLLDPRFDPAGLILAVRDGEIVGVAYAVAGGQDGHGVAADGGWIPLLLVVPSARRGGVGAELLALAQRHLAARGSRWANVAGYPPGYLIPGVDVERSPEGVALLERAGFRTVEEPVGMRIRLAEHATPADLAAAESSASAGGYRFAAATAGDLPESVRFAATINADWGEAVRDSLRRHGDPSRVRLVRAPGGEVVGFATFGSYDGAAGRFGPFGVDPSHRGRALGRILLHQTMAQMRARGADEAWFLWADGDGAAARLYTGAGFRPFRRFRVMQRAVDTGAADVATTQGGRP